jgi:NMD protein affecting ribosome stability and mRNA decay
MYECARCGADEERTQRLAQLCMRKTHGIMMPSLS